MTNSDGDLKNGFDIFDDVCYFWLWNKLQQCVQQIRNTRTNKGEQA